MMGIEEAILSAFVSYLFKSMVPKHDIEGAPSWYMKEIDSEKLAKSAFSKGDLSSIEIAKDKVKNKLVFYISYIVQESVDDVQVFKGKETVANLFKEDKNLKNFVLKNIQYENITYQKKDRKAFVRGFIYKKAIKDYQEKRIFSVKKQHILQDIEEMKKSF